MGGEVGGGGREGGEGKGKGRERGGGEGGKGGGGGEERGKGGREGHEKATSMEGPAQQIPGRRPAIYSQVYNTAATI